MFSFQQLFSKRDRFQELLETAARETHETVRLAIELIKLPFMPIPTDTSGVNDHSWVFS